MQHVLNSSCHIKVFSLKHGSVIFCSCKWSEKSKRPILRKCKYREKDESTNSAEFQKLLPSN